MNRIRIIRKLAQQNLIQASSNGMVSNRNAIIAGVVGGVCLASAIGEQDKIRAKSDVAAKSDEVVASPPLESSTEESGSEKKPEKGFRKKKLMQYENKIRRYAQPDKVFRYFATIQACYPDGKKEDIYMTPDDFVRSLTPDGELQPQDCLIDRFRTVKTAHRGSKMTQKELESVEKTFAAFGGYINYEDYIFLLTVLTTPKRNFEIAFRMFDLDGNGVVDADEFDKVSEIIMKGTSVAKTHKASKKKQSNIARYFFGDEKDKELTADEFMQFQSDMQYDILRMEFDKMEPDENNMISQKAFANMILIHAQFDEDKNKKIRKRIRKLFKKKKVKHVNEETGEVEIEEIVPEYRGVTFDEVFNFFEFMKNIHDVDTAFAFYAMSGKEIDLDAMRSVAKTVCGLELSEDILTLIFAVFDEDDSKTLSRREFVDVMKARLQRGLDSKRGIDFTQKVWAISTCACETYLPEFIKQKLRNIDVLDS